jgi:16S rRNA (guanine527-N7)-methyltransferase
MTPATFQRLAAVSRETLERLELYHQLLSRWQSKLNLVGPTTLADPWRRHFLDSAQLRSLLLESTRTVVDLGSGAGFPGLVLAIIGGYQIHLIESDQRKVAFLREVAAATAAAVTIHPTRIEAAPPLSADVVCARALAPLARLLDYAIPFLGAHSVCLFPKGRQVETELAEAGLRWSFTVERFASLSESSGQILRLSALSPR